jgi:hypothetical protein
MPGYYYSWREDQPVAAAKKIGRPKRDRKVNRAQRASRKKAR